MLRGGWMCDDVVWKPASLCGGRGMCHLAGD